MLALFLLNVEAWFLDPFSPHQLIAWFLLCVSLIPLYFGVRSLTSQGKPGPSRGAEPQLLAFEKTSALVTTGIYRYIRHPLYSSLIFLNWGIFFKSITGLGALLALAATLLLTATALTDESECVQYFGEPYRKYMGRTKRFVPFLF
jgi:protein-S-isoprenylcysteine O-methyltransferase Ste14